MAGRSSLVATAEQKAVLRALPRSDVRGVADRARAILLTLQGWTSWQVAAASGVTADAVRHWRGWFSERGVDALRSTLMPGPLPEKGQRAPGGGEPVAAPARRGPHQRTLPRLRAEVERGRSP